MPTKRKTALITGASSGIGLELAKLFAKNEYHLVLISQREDNLQTAAAKIQELYKDVQITLLPKDLSQPTSPQEIYDFVKEKSINVDALVNNAGIQVYGNFHEANLEDNLQLMSVNMISLVKLTRLFLNDMVKSGSGKILNLGSTGSFSPCPLNAVYCASKAFVLHFSEGIAEELKGTGVTVTTLCPGATRTNFARRADIQDTKMFKGKVMEAAEVAAIGYKALMRGKSVVVAGASNKLLVESIRLMPRSLVPGIGKGMIAKR